MSANKFNKLFTSIVQTYNQNSNSLPGLGDDTIEEQEVDKLPLSKIFSATPSQNSSHIKSKIHEKQQQSQIQENFSYNKDDNQLKITDLVQNSETLKQFTYVEYVNFDLKSKQISDIKCSLLANNFRMLLYSPIKKLKLNLSKNSMGDRGFYDIISIVQKLSLLEKININLDYCNVTDQSVNYIVDNLKNSNELREISLMLNNTCITENSVRNFYESFNPKTRSITQSELKCNNLDVEKHKRLMKKRENKYLDKSLKNPSVGTYDYGEKFGDWSVQDSNTVSQSNFNSVYSQQQPLQQVKQHYQQQQQQPQQQAQQQQYQYQQYQQQQNQQQPQQQQYHQQQQQQQQQQQSFSSFQECQKKQVQPQIVEDTKKISPQEQQEENKLENQYGKGFNILKNFGYKVGTGLGKNNDGIVEPVKANNQQKLGKKFTSKNLGGSNLQEKSYFENLAENSNIQGPSKILRFEKKGQMVVGKQDSENSDEKDQQQLQQEQEEYDENTNPNSYQQSQDSQNNTLIFNTVFNLSVNNQTQNTQLNHNNYQNANGTQQQTSSSKSNSSTKKSMMKASVQSKQSVKTPSQKDGVQQSQPQLQQQQSAPSINQMNDFHSALSKNSQQQNQQSQQQQYMNNYYQKQQQQQQNGNGNPFQQALNPMQSSYQTNPNRHQQIQQGGYSYSGY